MAGDVLTLYTLYAVRILVSSFGMGTRDMQPQRTDHVHPPPPRPPVTLIILTHNAMAEPLQLLYLTHLVYILGVDISLPSTEFENPPSTLQKEKTDNQEICGL